MNASPKTGSVGETRFVVENQHTIAFPDAGLPPVLSTPSLIWFLEHAAIEALKPCLEQGEVSVGTEVEMQHLAATPLGMTVVCTARIVQANGPVVSFHVEARDDRELIARGFHTRRVIKAASLAKRVQTKLG
jgi:fluoroacetyl-CoA thioesterase